ncbi:MAG: 2-succinyl-5-enolpyruvyl-6-hydroxy-3-cyclohexene-1-carboxylic-acid synthase [Chthoniobacterales bacterium]|nr:2-succinyl-5-enolpyruvyl-6-hydroxy-3-cyclohexene-1-carboxylic-acid synthase [Chthoniobacterales bacterium]
MESEGSEWNLVWGEKIIESLILSGVRSFCLSPGARSIPLAISIWEKRKKVDVKIHYDERGMAFYALGKAHATGKPVVCLTTSGSAVANLAPAVVEAFYSFLPLVVITADRPPELREKGANQTIWQPGIFGKFTKKSVDLSCPNDEELCFLEETITEIVHVAQGNPPGPVHINVPFREPLIKRGNLKLTIRERGERKLCEIRTKSLAKNCCVCEGRISKREIKEIATNLSQYERGIILVGELAPFYQSRRLQIICTLGEVLGWPVVVSALSGMKSWRKRGCLIFYASDWLSEVNGFPNPEYLVWLGGRIVTKVMESFFSQLKGDRVLRVYRFPTQFDPYLQKPKVLTEEEVFFCAQILEILRKKKIKRNNEWLEKWLFWDRKSEEEKRRLANTTKILTEQQVARFVFRISQELGVTLFLGNSRSIRDFETNAGGEGKLFKVFGQRGASGIDGNISHIAGFASESRKAVLGLVGDLAVLHDLNSLFLLRGMPVVLVVANNDGGGIFWKLKIDVPVDVCVDYLQTPHGLNFRHICRMYGIDYFQSNDVRHIEEKIRDFCGKKKPLFVEIPIKSSSPKN